MIEEAACSASREPYFKRPLFLKGVSQAKKFCLKSGRQVPKCLLPHGRPYRIVRCSPSNGAKKGIARSGIRWCFGAGLAGPSCSIRNAHFADMYGPCLVV